MIKELLRSRLLEDLSVVHEDHSGSHFLANPISCVTTTMVMPSLASCFIMSQNLADHLRIQRGCGAHRRGSHPVHGKGPDDRHPLFLPAGQRGRINVRLIIQADPLQQLHCLLFCLRF